MRIFGSCATNDLFLHFISYSIFKTRTFIKLTEDWVIKLSTVQRNMVTQSRCTCLFFFFFSLWNLEYKVDPSSPETSIHNEWLVNLMYATVESCSACSQPCLRLGWDHNEAIFLTDFSTCWSSDASEPQCCFQCGATGSSAQVMEGSHGSPLGLPTAETITGSFNY